MSKEKEFWYELTHYVFLAIALALFFVSFVTLGKIGLSKLPFSGPSELFASA